MRKDINRELVKEVENFLAKKTRAFSWRQIQDNLEGEPSYNDLYLVLKVLVQIKRVKVVTPPDRNERYYQHIINDEKYAFPDYEEKKKEQEEKIDPCPGINPCPFFHRLGICTGCPVLTGEVDHWKKIPCPECGTKPLKRLGTTLKVYCPNCSWDKYYHEEN